MTQFLARAGLAALLAVGALSAAAMPAAAQADVDIYFGGRPPPPPPPGYGRPPPPPPGYGYDNPPPGYGYNRPPPPPPPGYGRRGCNPQMAEDIAGDYGFRRARVVDVTPRRVIVQGFTRRGPDEITFGNVRGCPVLRR